MDFVQRIRATDVAPGEVAVFWLGQAGFLIKTCDGKLVAVDPYLSECVERLLPEEGVGFKRLMPLPCRAEELELDALLISHEHLDHFDVDAVPALMACGRTQLYTNAPVGRLLRDMPVDAARVHVMEKGERMELPGMRLTAVDCDHGALAPEALGFLMDFGCATVYYAGDTALTVDRLRAPVEAQPDVAILPINGAFGNLDGEQAARYAGMLGARQVIPCHFWTFPLHHGDPQQIIDALPGAAPECRLALLCQGEGRKFGARETGCVKDRGTLLHGQKGDDL